MVGCENVLKDFYNALLKEFELKCTLIGGGKQHQRSALYLGRTVTWTEDGYTWEPDEKHAQVLIRTLGLEQCKPSATPYCQESKDTLQQYDHELSELEIRTHRGNVARVVYLAQDRMNLSVSACLLATSMANPRGSDQARLKRVGRYLKGRNDSDHVADGQRLGDVPEHRTIEKWWHYFRRRSSGFALVSAPNASGTVIRRS